MVLFLQVFFYKKYLTPPLSRSLSGAEVSFGLSTNIGFGYAQPPILVHAGH
jgi:hypothetical protein